MVDDLSWCILRTEPRREFMAENALRGHRVEVALPYWFHYRLWRGQPSKIRTPLFPGYMFARLPTQGGKVWDYVRTVGGLMKMNPSPAVRMNHKIVTVEPFEIQAIMTAAEGMRNPRPEVRCFAVGELVRAIGGAFQGMVGEIDKLEDGERVSILFDWLGRKVPTSVAEDDIAAA